MGDRFRGTTDLYGLNNLRKPLSIRTRNVYLRDRLPSQKQAIDRSVGKDYLDRALRDPCNRSGIAGSTAEDPYLLGL
jgi:hypothetical protein